MRRLIAQKQGLLLAATTNAIQYRSIIN